MNESIDQLRSQFGLTRAEAQLTLHLITGETLRSAAAKFDISYQTARTHLKNIFNKTGACRQAELVLVIFSALPRCLKATPSGGGVGPDLELGAPLRWRSHIGAGTSPGLRGAFLLL
jgi:DNA-binding CsgD family transcriptional regulator